MALPVSGPCSAGFNYSSRFSSTRDSTEKCLLRFSEEFMHHKDEVRVWYDKQPYNCFRTIQYRKEKTAIGHEFILICLQGKDLTETESYCRVERVGDIEHRFQAICVDGTVAEDYIQAIPLSNPQSVALTHNSDVVAEITFPLTFDLADVLAICYGISKHKRAKKYTLQQYNCYFFSWTLIIALARACMNWNISGSIQECIRNVRNDISKYIDEQGPARLHSVAYILSNSAYPMSKHGEHPLDEHVRNWLDDSRFAASISRILYDSLWPSRLQSKIAIILREELLVLASRSMNLLAWEEAQARTMEFTVAQNENTLKFEKALRKLTWKAILVGAETMQKMSRSMLAKDAPDHNIIKQRMGHELWYNCVKNSLRHPIRALDSKRLGSCEFTDSLPYCPIKSLTRDYLFIPPAFILSLCCRLGLVFPMIIASYALHVRLEYVLGRHGHGNRFQRTVQCIGKTACSGTFDALRAIAASKQLLCIAILQHNQDKLGPFYTDFLGQIQENEDTIVWEGFRSCFGLLNDGLHELINNHKGAKLSFLRPYLCVVLKDIAEMGNWELSDKWGAIVLQHFLDKLAEF